MQNDQGQNVDLYVPRKCSWTKRLITANDFAACQINIGDVDPSSGKYLGSFKTFAISGYVRQNGESDTAVAALIAAAEKKQ